MTTAEMAEVLRQHYIEDVTRKQPEAVSLLNEAAAERCRIKTRLFRLALVLMTLHRKESDDVRLAEVILNLEKFTYPNSSNQSVPFAMALGAATDDLSELISLAQNRETEG